VVTPIFSVSNVTKEYRTGFWGRRTRVLQNVDLIVAEGEAVGFIGHNGAGKSSTIRLMLGLQAPTSGTVMIRGRPANDPLARVGVSYLPEIPLLYDYLTPGELLRMALHFHNFQGDCEQQIKVWLDRMRIQEVANKRVKGFSKGMSQRVALAMALCAEPSVLVLDEPLSGLDPVGRREVVEILEEYRQKGGTLFFSSHVLSDVERLADRFVFIHQGKIGASYSVDSVLKASANSYELTVCTDAPPAGYERIGRNLWRRQVSSESLAESISQILDCGGLLHSVRSSSNLEDLYLGLMSAGDLRRG